MLRLNEWDYKMAGELLGEKSSEKQHGGMAGTNK
jgi:hypothetical protein